MEGAHSAAVVVDPSGAGDYASLTTALSEAPSWGLDSENDRILLRGPIHRVTSLGTNVAAAVGALIVEPEPGSEPVVVIENDGKTGHAFRIHEGGEFEFRGLIVVGQAGVESDSNADGFLHYSSVNAGSLTFENCVFTANDGFDGARLDWSGPRAVEGALKNPIALDGSGPLRFTVRDTVFAYTPAGSIGPLNLTGPHAEGSTFLFEGMLSVECQSRGFQIRPTAGKVSLTFRECAFLEAGNEVFAVGGANSDGTDLLFEDCILKSRNRGEIVLRFTEAYHGDLILRRCTLSGVDSRANRLIHFGDVHIGRPRSVTLENCIFTNAEDVIAAFPDPTGGVETPFQTFSVRNCAMFETGLRSSQSDQIRDAFANLYFGSGPLTSDPQFRVAEVGEWLDGVRRWRKGDNDLYDVFSNAYRFRATGLGNLAGGADFRAGEPTFTPTIGPTATATPTNLPTKTPTPTPLPATPTPTLLPVDDDGFPLEVSYSADVVVVGGNLGGSIAAAVAAGKGVDTLLLVESGSLAIDSPLLLGERIGEIGGRPLITEGMIAEFVAMLPEIGVFAHEPMSATEVFASSEVTLRRHDVPAGALLRMLRESGARMLFHCRSSKTTLKDGRITHLIVESPQGRLAVAGRIFIDATELGRLAALSGVPMALDQPELRLAALLRHPDFDQSLDLSAYRDFIESDDSPLDDSFLHWLELELGGAVEDQPPPWNRIWSEFLGGDRMPRAVIRKMRTANEAGDLEIVDRNGEKGILAIVDRPSLGPNVARIEALATDVDPLEAEEIGWAEISSRIRLFEFHRFLRDRIPGFQGGVVERVGDRISVIQRRRIAVDDPPTSEEVRRGSKRPETVYLHRIAEGEGVFHVPYRMLLPEGVEGLLVLDGAQGGGPTLRTPHGAMLQGQAAGTAAALGIGTGRGLRQLDIGLLQDVLRADGVIIPSDLGRPSWIFVR